MDCDSKSEAPTSAHLSDFITIYKWRVIRQDTPWNVQRFEGNHCENAQDFNTYEKALAWAESFNLPVIHEHSSQS